MDILELKKNFYYVGIVDHDLKVFDVAVLTDYGTSYNSYILKTDAGNILFEGNKEVVQEKYLEHIKQITEIEDIKYLVVSHTEPDHSGAIKMLLELNPDITVIASFAALKNLKNITRLDFKSVTAKPGATMEIGGYHLSFVSGLLLHWPDVMFTYVEELKTLVTCDAFGAHYASDAILLSKEPHKDDYYKALKYYYDHIIGPFPTYVIQACERVENLDIDMICPGHGPVVDTGVKDQINLYRKLAESSLPVNDENKVTIVYSSAYGYTREIAEILRDKYLNDGKTVEFFEIDALNYAESKPKILDSMRTSGTVLLGSPTLVGDAICLFYDLLLSVTWTMCQGKKASAFGDYGWSGEAVGNLTVRLQQLKFKTVEGYKWCFKLDDQGLKELDEYYERLKA